MRSLLDKFYFFCGFLSASTMLLMVLLILSQIVARFFDTHIPSSDDISGYMVAWTTFLGLSYAMHKNDHIHVDLFIGLFPEKVKNMFSATVNIFAFILISFFLYFVILAVKESYDFGDTTTGLIPMPLWIIQIPFAFGIFALDVSVADRLFSKIKNEPASTESNL